MQLHCNALNKLVVFHKFLCEQCVYFLGYYREPFLLHLVMICISLVSKNEECLFLIQGNKEFKCVTMILWVLRPCSRQINRYSLRFTLNNSEKTILVITTPRY